MLKAFLNALYEFIFQPKPDTKESPLAKSELIGFVIILLLLGFLGACAWLLG